MSSEDRIWSNMDSDSGDESSEKEESDELLGATGNSRLRDHNGADEETEDETSARRRTEEKSGSSRSEQGEKCSCNSTRPTRLTFEAFQMRCILCGGVIDGSRTNFGKANTFVPSPARKEVRGPLIGAVPTSYAVTLPTMPSTNLEDDTSEPNGRSHSPHQRAASLVTGRPREGKTPVLNVCEHSVQSPSTGLTVTMFLFERTHRERNEKWYTLYIIPETDFKVYETICKSHMEEANDAASQQGYNSRQIPFAVDNSRSQEFHSVHVHEEISVSFEIQNRWQENFVGHDVGQEFVFRVPVIRCESKNRVTPGAKSHFRVEYVGERGKPCQEQGKITLTIDSTVQNTLFFSIAIWVDG